MYIDGTTRAPIAHLTSSTPDEQTQAPPAAHQGPSPPPSTPQHRTDQAVSEYDQAVASGDNARIAKAKQGVYAAVRGEIGPQIDAANAHIPADFQTPADQQIKAYGNIILRRHANDPTAQDVVNGAIGDYSIQRQADTAMPQFIGNFTPKQKLDGLTQAAQSQPPDVAARMMQSPAAQRIVNDAVNWVAQPYNTASPGDITAAKDASQRLLDITSGLPPQYAQQIVSSSMPTIRKIAATGDNGAGAYSKTFNNMARVVGNLGDDSQARTLTNEVARAYTKPVEQWQGMSENRTGYMISAMNQGGSCDLVLALANTLQVDGDRQAAGEVVDALAQHALDLQDKVHHDVKVWGDQAKDLNGVINSSKGLLTDAQMGQAVDKFVSDQGKDWQDALNAKEDNIVQDASDLNSFLGMMHDAGGDLKQAFPDAFQSVNGVGHDETTQAAIEFAAQRDPGVFGGEHGTGAAEFWVEEGDRSSELLQTVAASYVSSHVLPQFEDLDITDPAQVAKAHAALDDFESKAVTLFGMPRKEVDAAVGQLNHVLDGLQSEPANEQVKDGFKTAQTNLENLSSMTFSNDFDAKVFRAIGFGLTGAAAIFQINKIGASQNLPMAIGNTLGALSDSLGTVQDGTALITRLGLINPNGSVGQWATAVSDAGKMTERFIGLFDAGFFFSSAVSDALQHNLPAEVADFAGGAGATVSALGEEAGLSALSGPAVGVTLLAVLFGEVFRSGKETAEQTQRESDFLAGAHLPDKVVAALSSNAAQESNSVQAQLGLSPVEMQALAATHPEIFNSGPAHARAVVDVAQACGIPHSMLLPFVNALQKDNPNWLDDLATQDSQYDPNTQLMTQRAQLFETVVQQYPTAATMARQIAPGLFGPTADAQRQADRDFQGPDGSSTSGIGNLLAQHSNDAAYQTEIIRLLGQYGRLDSWLHAISGPEYNGNAVAAATKAIRSARGAGVLSSDQAQRYLAELGGT